MYEDLIRDSQNEKIDVIERPLKGNLKGLYYSNTIAVSSRLVTDAEKSCILAEEIGHHYRTYGNILNLENVRELKKEKIARNWAYEKLVSLNSLIEVFKLGIRSKHEIAEHLNVTEEFLEAAIKHYKEKYGANCEFDDYYIYFEPNFGILKMF